MVSSLQHSWACSILLVHILYFHYKMMILGFMSVGFTLLYMRKLFQFVLFLFANASFYLQVLSSCGILTNVAVGYVPYCSQSMG